MIFLQLAVVMIALYLFLVFLAQPFLIAWRVFLSWLEHGPLSVREDPDAVDPTPLGNINDLDYSVQLGRDRLGRMIYKAPDGAGGFRFFYFDGESSDERPKRARAKRRARTRRYEGTSRPNDGGSRLALGWKGFDEHSSPWQILGVARDASIAQVKAAYRKLITKFHPDRFQHLSAAELADLERDTKLIHAAYARLVKP